MTTRHPARTTEFPKPFDYYTQLARDHQRIADCPGYRGNPEARAAELHKVATYTQLAAAELSRKPSSESLHQS